MSYCPTKTPTALYQNVQRSPEVLETFNKWRQEAIDDPSMSPILKHFQDAGTATVRDDLSTVRTGTTVPFPKDNFKRVSIGPLECDSDYYEEGEITVQDGCNPCGTRRKTLVNIKGGDCSEEFTKVSVGQGFEMNKPEGLKQDYESDIFCAEELERFAPSIRHSLNEQVKKTMMDYAMLNKKLFLSNMIMDYGKLNSSVAAANMGDNIISPYGLNAIPKGLLSIEHLYQYFNAANAVGGTWGGKIYLHGPIRDAINAIDRYNASRREKLGINCQDLKFHRSVIDDPKHALYNREKIEFDVFVFIDNPNPRKITMVQKGSRYEYRNVWKWKNSTKGISYGSVPDYNEDYFRQYSMCDGYPSPVITLWEVLPRGGEYIGKIWGLAAEDNPEDRTLSNDLSFRAVIGADLGPCNKKRTKWQYILGQGFGVRIDDDNIGVIACVSEEIGASDGKLYKPSAMGPSDFCPATITREDDCPDEVNKCDDGCGEQEECVNSIAELAPSPHVEFYYNGEELEAAINIELTSPVCEDSTIEYEFVDGSAVFGTDYVHSIDADNLLSPEEAESQIGTIELKAGDNQTRIKIPFTILKVDKVEDMINKIDATLTLTAATGSVELGENVETTLCMIDNVLECEDTPTCDPVPKEEDCEVEPEVIQEEPEVIQEEPEA